jgi:hypothetical protein
MLQTIMGNADLNRIDRVKAACREMDQMLGAAATSMWTNGHAEFELAGGYILRMETMPGRSLFLELVQSGQVQGMVLPEETAREFFESGLALIEANEQKVTNVVAIGGPKAC